MRGILRYFHISKLGIYLYTILNFTILVLLLYYLSEEQMEPKMAVLNVGCVYLISFIIAISPIGEWIVRLTTGCHRIDNTSIYNRLNRLLNDCINSVHAYNPSIRIRVKMYIHYDDSYNAFACGRHTICVNTGLLELDDDAIRGIISHEIGHIVNKDTTFLLITTITNSLTSLVIFLCVIFLRLALFITSLFDYRNAFIIYLIVLILWVIPFKIATKIWQFVCRLLIAISSRSNEYEADRFAFLIGYGNELAYALSIIDGTAVHQSWIQELFTSHPATPKRIMKLNSYA